MIRKLTLLIMLAMATLSYSQADLAINPSTALTTPADGCSLSATESISVFLVNTSGFPYSGTVELGYILNGGAPVTLNVVIGILNASGTFNYTFPIPDDFSACQGHDLQVWCYDVSDPNNLNDTASFTIISDCPPVVGSLSGSEGTIVCSGINNGNVQLTGYSGLPTEWLISFDGGASWISNPVPGNDDTLAYSNITGQLVVKVVVASMFGICPSDTSSWFTINVDPLSDAGVLPADFDICDNGNGGFVETTGYYGGVIDWLISTDNGVTWSNTGFTNDSLAYTNLTTTTLFQVVVQTPYCPSDSSNIITLTLIPGSEGGTIVGETVVCNQVNDSSLQVTGFTGDTFLWWYSLDSGATWLPTTDTDSIFEYTNLTSGNVYFSAEVTLGGCQSSWSTPHIITVLPLNFAAGPDTTITEGDAVQLYASNGGTTYFWYPDNFMDDPSLQNPTVSPDVNTTYNVIITDFNGCVDTATAIVTVQPDITTLVIPNLFTPNGDGFNDFWYIANLDYFVNNQVSVFNIYGQLVYEMDAYANNWDGTSSAGDLPDGTYFYILRLNDPLYPELIQGEITIAGR